MATITKPILLDETGQTMAGHLQAIAAALAASMPIEVVDDTTTAAATAVLQPNKTYRFLRSEGVTSLAISLATPESDDVENEYTVEFISGSTPTVVTWPTGYKWADGFAPVIGEGHYRAVFIKPNNLAMCVRFAEVSQ